MKQLSLLLIVFSLLTVMTYGESIQKFGVKPENSPQLNKANLQKAIDSMTIRGGVLYVDPTDVPYKIAGGLVLKRNVSLVGGNAATPRGTRHPTERRPVGSVIEITDRENVFITVESATQISGIQFWYSEQTTKDPDAIVEYPPTIRLSYERSTEGVTLNNLTFYGEYLAMDFAAKEKIPCELITIEHCYGYPLSGTFIRIDRCYDIPRLLHCHVNPAINRSFAGGYSKAVIDRVISKKSFAYIIEHTDNAQLIDVFTFGTYGGIYLGADSYGQITNFNLDCVTIGIYKRGSNSFNRNWQIAQGAIIANVGSSAEEIHPILIDGKGHTSITNVEAFSGGNGALTTLGKSYDFIKVEGSDKCSVILTACRMRNYISDSPLTIANDKAVIRAIGCIDKNEDLFTR
jgi:hypothetical protein